MKLSVARVFEVSQIAASKAYGELQPFVSYVNDFTDNVIRVLQKGVGIQDNLDAEIKTASLTHGSGIAVAFRKRPIAVVLCAGSGTALNPVTSFYAEPGESADQAKLTATFLTAKDAAGNPTKQDVQVLAFFS